MPLNEESLSYQCLRKELLFSDEDANKKTTPPLMPCLDKLAVADILKELMDPSKAASKMMSLIAGEFSWDITS